MNSSQALKIVEQYSRKTMLGYGDITVAPVSDQKTVFVSWSKRMVWGGERDHDGPIQR